MQPHAQGVLMADLRVCHFLAFGGGGVYNDPVNDTVFREDIHG